MHDHSGRSPQPRAIPPAFLSVCVQVQDRIGNVDEPYLARVAKCPLGAYQIIDIEERSYHA